MNFFKSVFSDEPDSPKPESKSSLTNPSQSESDPTSPPDLQQPNADNHRDDDGGDDNDYTATVWSFGGLIRTLTTKSGSVIEIYRRDLKEFGSGLKKEIEVAHGSLETVGHAIDEIGTSVIKGTAQIISHGKDVILASDDHESDSSDNMYDRSISSQQSFNSKPYSRFDAQLRLIQGDVSTYCEGPEDLDDYKTWKSGFIYEEKGEEIESLIQENGAIENIYKRVVPNNVDEETFWCRYYYKVFKFKQAEDTRANLVKRAISTEEEDLSWDVDDDDDEEPVSLKKTDESGHKDKERVKSDEIDTTANRESDQRLNVKDEETKNEKIVNSYSDDVASEKVDLEKNKEREASVSKSEDKAGLEGKVENVESSKDSDLSVISSQPSMPEEDDLEWDEIEDLSSIDEKKVSNIGSPNKADFRKRFSAAEEEDLSWDIDDDDEPAKA